MKPSKKYLVPALFGLLALNAPDAGAANVSAPIYQPNNYAKSITTPIAWGASNTVIFMGAGGSVPAPYDSKNDGAAIFGLGVGDPDKNLGVQIALVSLDLSQWDRYSISAHLHHNIGNASAVAVGVENVMLTDGGDAGKSFYAVYSESVQSSSFVNKKTGKSKLSYSIGAGTGRFGDKSPDDIATGKGKHGTYVFGNIAYDVADAFNIVTDWNGLNLNAGVSKTIWVAKIPIAAVVGAADLTKNSGDGVRLVFAVGTAFKL